MKKLVAMVFASCMVLSLGGCGGNQEKPKNPTSSSSNESKVDVKQEFNKKGTIQESVLYEQDGVKLSALELDYHDTYVEMKLFIENATDQEVEIHTATLGYCANAINGHMIKNGYMSASVQPGKSCKETIDFEYDVLKMYGIYAISDITLGLAVDVGEADTINVQTKKLNTAIADTFDYKKDYYGEFMSENVGKQMGDITITHFANDNQFDKEGIVGKSSLMFHHLDDAIVFYELENTGDEALYAVSSDIKVNGIKVQSLPWDNVFLLPQTSGVLEFEIANLIEDEVKKILEIESVATLSFEVTIKNEDGKEYASDEVELIFEKDEEKMKVTGNELYNDHGVRIVQKGVYTEDGDIKYVLLIENTSSKKLKIDEVYDSTSVNDMMCTSLVDYLELKPNEVGITTLELASMYLDEIDVQGLKDIKTVETCLEISENYDTIAEANITLSNK